VISAKTAAVSSAFGVSVPFPPRTCITAVSSWWPAASQGSGGELRDFNFGQVALTATIGSVMPEEKFRPRLHRNGLTVTATKFLSALSGSRGRNQSGELRNHDFAIQARTVPRRAAHDVLRFARHVCPRWMLRPPKHRTYRGGETHCPASRRGPAGGLSSSRLSNSGAEGNRTSGCPSFRAVWPQSPSGSAP
jgi:hypothetical protein